MITKFIDSMELKVEAKFNKPKPNGSRSLYMREQVGEIKDADGKIIADISVPIGGIGLVVSFGGLNCYYIDLSKAAEQLVETVINMNEPKVEG